MVEMRTTFLDVGQGDATIAMLPDGSGILVDCPSGRAPIVVDYLEKSHINQLELAVITHSDIDHAGGVVDAIKGFQGITARIGELVDRQVPSDPNASMQHKILLRDLVQLMRSGVGHWAPYADERIDLSGVSVTVLHPSEADRLEALLANDRNNCSITLRLEYAGIRLLLTGDLQRKGWRSVIDRKSDLKSDVLKFPHHGAWYDGDPTLGKVLELVDPSLVVVSVGTTNGYHHPSAQTLALLRGLATGVRFVCTQATGQCHGDPRLAADTARQLVPEECRDGHSFTHRRSCPCAGNVTVSISDDGMAVTPTQEQHDRVIGIFDTPQCK